MNHKNLFALDDKQIVIAGGAGQLGFHFAKTLAESGAFVKILDIDIDNALPKLNSLSFKIKSKISLSKVDVSSENSIHNFYSNWDKNRSLYGLINCFHYKGNTRKLDRNSNFFRDFKEYPKSEWMKVMDVNLTGTFLVSKASVPFLKNSRGSRIVNICSTYGIVSPNPKIYGKSGINSPVSYAASKSGIINLTKYMAIHLAKYNINVNALSPGGIFNKQDPDFVKEYCKLTPLGRMSEVDDYSTSILYLMSPFSSYLTGENIVVDGGWTSW